MSELLGKGFHCRLPGLRATAIGGGRFGCDSIIVTKCLDGMILRTLIAS